MLSQRVVQFEPDSQQRLNFAGTSCLPVPQSGTPQEGGRSKSGRGKGTFEGESKRRKKPWYEGPTDSGLTDLTFGLSYVSNLSKGTMTSKDKVNSHSSEPSGGNGMGLQQQKYSYSTPSILPPAMLHGEGEGWRVVCVSVQVGRVVVYCGQCKEGGGGGTEEEMGFLTVNSIPAKAVVLYQTDKMQYSVTM